MENPADLLYAHRAKPYSSELELRLTDRELIAEKGKSRQAYRLDKLERIRLSFSPRNTSKLTFVCEVRASDGSSVTFDNLNWKSLIETERLDAPFRALVLALIERASRANPKLTLEAGVGPVKFNVMRLIGFGLVGTLVGATVYAAAGGNTVVAFGALALGIYLASWLWDFLSRNQPRAFTADAVPENVLPKPLP